MDDTILKLALLVGGFVVLIAGLFMSNITALTFGIGLVTALAITLGIDVHALNNEVKMMKK